MIWQDVVIAIANIVLGYSIFYQVYVGFIEKKGFLTFQTSILTTISLYAITIALFSLGLWISAIATGINATLWLLLLFQRVYYPRA